MKFRLESAIEVLRRTPSALDGLLRGLPEEWLANNEGGESWSPFDILGHLVHGDRTDWIPRVRIIIESGESRAFEPFDRWAQFRDSEGKSISDLLDEFARLRQDNLRVLSEMGLKPTDLPKKGRHPELGPCTLGQLLATWVVHDLGHVRQIARVMAKQYKEEVGIWREYLPVLGK